jgi:hypothetical protein
MGEVAVRSTDGEGERSERLCSILSDSQHLRVWFALSVAFGASSPKGRAKEMEPHQPFQSFAKNLYETPIFL